MWEQHTSIDDDGDDGDASVFAECLGDCERFIYVDEERVPITTFDDDGVEWCVGYMHKPCYEGRPDEVRKAQDIANVN